MRAYHARGVALITAMLVVSLASVLAVALVDHLNFDTQRTSNLFRLNQAMLFNRASVEVSRSALLQDRIGQPTSNDFDTLAEIQFFNNNMASFPIEGGSIATSIADLQACFNLNNLSPDNNPQQGRQQALYTSLLSQLGINPSDQAILVDSLIDWIDGNIIAEVNGAEFDYYLGQQPAYQNANRPLTSISELRLVRGYTDEIINQIKGHVCVLPANNSAINLNTASLEVIESIDGLAGHGEDIMGRREQGSFEDIDDIQQYVTSTLRVRPFNVEGIQVYSEYFLLRSETTLGNNRTALYSIIYRNQSNGRTSIIRQARGEL